MFTGIIQETGTIEKIEEHNGLKRFSIKAPLTTPKLTIGSSVSIDGTCLTVITQNTSSFTVEAIPETLQRTIAGSYKEQSTVNLETSMKIGESLDGHLVSGHIDSKGKILEIRSDGDTKIFAIEFPENLEKYFAFKGSVAINGVSLTITKIEKNFLEVHLIPHTQKVTNLGSLEPGMEVNLEVDMVARYLERLMDEANLMDKLKTDMVKIMAMLKRQGGF